MSLECFIGPEENLVETTENHVNRLSLPHPILSNQELDRIRNMSYHGWKSSTRARRVGR